MPRLLRFAASAALLVSAATLVSRLFGFVRWVAFSPTVGAGAVGTAYQSANQIPNILYEVVAGGALAGAVVPLLAAPLALAQRKAGETGPGGSAESGGTAEAARAEASRIASALLTWSVTLTLPLAAAVMVLHAPLAALITPTDAPGSTAFISGFLLVFAPQLVLYAVGGVLTGVLQAHRRFLWPAFMPLVSSLIVIGVYAGYAVLRGPESAAPADSALALLGWGTTAGVAAMTLPLALPARSTGIRFRPTWSFPPGVARRAVKLAGAGMSVLLAQQLATLVILMVSNKVGGSGVFAVFGYVQAVYLLPYAVLAVPVATVAFPKLAGLVAETGPAGPTDAFIAGTTRLVVLLGLTGAAVLAAASAPLQVFFSTLDTAHGESAPIFSALGLTVVVIAAAVPGWCMVAWGTRVFYALERSRFATLSAAAGWSLVAVSVLAAVPFVAAAPGPRTLVALGAAHAVGMTVAGVCLLAGIARVRGRGALAGLPRTLVVGVVGAAGGGAAGFLVARLALAGSGGLPFPPAVLAVLAGLCAGLVAVAVTGAVAFALDRGALAQARALR
ncbi:murein biosynthesis integral membrane protein MurJ [Brevibacterium salitolerans]|uniref:Lipid II flippase MurJ n=1 Tax=Brevibacterium salitolerans TaxID=1403566 RepID=A0ABN2X9M3_9MICO